jgi:UDP-2,3-diacylglucosamine pyrophosphatase LpxH
MSGSWCLPNENPSAVIRKKLVARLSRLFRQVNRFTLEGNEVLFGRGLREEALKTTTQQNMQSTIKCDQTCIESRIVKT